MCIPAKNRRVQASFAGGFFPFLPAVNYHSQMSSGEATDDRATDGDVCGRILRMFLCAKDPWQYIYIYMCVTITSFQLLVFPSRPYFWLILQFPTYYATWSWIWCIYDLLNSHHFQTSALFLFGPMSYPKLFWARSSASSLKISQDLVEQLLHVYQKRQADRGDLGNKTGETSKTPAWRRNWF